MNKKVIVFDTNALLDIYQYTNQTIEQIVNFFQSQSEYDLYISSFVHEEFKNHYLEARSKSGNRNPILKFKSKFNGFHNSTSVKINDLINDKSYKGYKTNIEAGLIDLREKVSVGLNDLKNEIESLYSIEDIGYSGDDLISDLVNSVYAKCNANKYNIHEKIFMSIIADQRIKLNLRPGLTDLKKEGFRKYSDIFIWLDLIKISKDYDEVVFIENEIKKDWWENDSYKEPADNIVREWEDLFDEKKTLTMIRLDALLISQAEAYLDGDAQLEITRLASEFLKSIKTKSMFLNLPVNDRLGDFAPNDIDFILLGEELNGGNIDEIEVLEMLEPETLTNDVRFQYDSTTRTLFAETQVKVPYIVNVINSFGRYSTPEYYHGTVYITFNCEFEFYLITNNDLEYYLNSVRYDIHKTSVDINELKASNVYDD